MERVHAVVASDGAVPRAGALARRLGYASVAAAVTAFFSGLADGPWAAGFAYAVLLLGVASISRAMLPPGHHQMAMAMAMAWCGYVLVAVAVAVAVAAPVTGVVCAGLAGSPGAALFGYALFLLGSALIALAMLPLGRPMERAVMLEHENRPVGNGIRRGHEAVVRAAGTMDMDWTGFFFVAAPVVASWAGLVEGPQATFFAFALLLLGVVFVIMAMLAAAKPKMA